MLYYKKKIRGDKMKERIRNLLRGSFWKIDISKVHLEQDEVDFLSYFFDISFDRVIDEWTSEERSFLVLCKKGKFIQNPLFR